MKISLFSFGKRGSLWLESLLTLNLLISITSVSLVLIYISFANFWLHHNLYEAILCVAKEFSSSKTCQRKLKKDIQQFLFLGFLETSKLKEKTNSFEGQLKWTFLNISLEKNLSIEKKDLKPSLKIRKVLL